MRATHLLWACALAAAALLKSGFAFATWSITVIDEDTGEVVVAAATCVTNFDLLRAAGVIRVGSGGGVAQAAVDSSGARRQLIANALSSGATAVDIANQLAALSGAGSAQHTLVALGLVADSAVHSGSNVLRDAPTRFGQVGELHYAIAGNVLANNMIAMLAENRLAQSAGPLVSRVQQAMRVARDAGGDARCSCTSWNSATGCQGLIPNFAKAAHIGFLLATRVGDIDDPLCNSAGCADGDYWLRINIANQSAAAVDPVLQIDAGLASALDGLRGRADAIASGVEFVGPPWALLLTPRDVFGDAVSLPAGAVRVIAVDSSLQPATPVSLADGRIRVALDGDDGGNEQRFRVELDAPALRIVLPPKRTSLALAVFASGFESSKSLATAH